MGNVYRRLNSRTLLFQPINVSARFDKSQIMINGQTISLPLNIGVTEKFTSRPVPHAPFTIYVNDVETYEGQTDSEGKYTYQTKFTEFGVYALDAYLYSRQLGRAFGSDTVSITLETIEIVPVKDCWVNSTNPLHTHNGEGIGVGIWR